MKMLRDFGCGAVVGVANIIPGVSGGTMAVVLNVYSQLLEALGLKNIKKNLPFLLSFGLGAAAGIVAFSHAIEFLLERYPMATNFTFIGLILGSIPMIWGKAAKGHEKVSVGSIGAFAAAFLLMLWMKHANGGQTEIIERITPHIALWLCVVAAISAFAMILPGISGSFVMLLLGAYPTVLHAISEFEISVLIVVAIGCALGLLLGSRLVSFLLEHCPQPTYFAILGLILGSLLTIYPGFHLSGEGIVSLVLLFAAAAATYWFSTTEG